MGHALSQYLGKVVGRGEHVNKPQGWESLVATYQIPKVPTVISQ